MKQISYEICFNFCVIIQKFSLLNLQIYSIVDCVQIRKETAPVNDDNVNDIDIIKTEELSSLGELAAVDKILTNAAAATDEGDYKGALDGFEHALEVTQRIFGDNIELTELKHKIADIHELLEEQGSEEQCPEE